jgi:site-specific recombinase XerD
MKQFLAWFKKGDIATAEERDIRNFLLDLQERGLAKRTRNRRLASVKSFYTWLWGNGYIKDNPTDRIRLERLSDNEKHVEPLDERVAINLLSITKTKTTTGKRSYAILDLLLGTGIRREELVELDLKDVNILQTRTSTITIRKGKGDKARVIPLAKPQKESLTKWIKVRSDYARDNKSEAVFITRLGTRPTGESIRQLVKSKLNQLGIDEKGISVHSLRHLFASSYNAANQNDLVGLQSITGHSNLSTLGIYTHPTLKRTEENLEKMSVNINR